MNLGTDSQRKKLKVFTLGKDGSTFNIILPLLEKGEFPNFERMINQGVWGELDVTAPPFSGLTWVSFVTGKNRGSS